VSIDRHLLDIVCCPVTRQPLETVPANLLERINSRIAAGTLTTVDNVAVTEPFLEALMTRDGRIAYPVLDGIPVLLEERGVHLGQID
jgi:uncharacterized protein YbaR (Trm112 family)